METGRGASRLEGPAAPRRLRTPWRHRGADGDGEPEVSPYAGQRVSYDYDARGRLLRRLHERVADAAGARPFIAERRYVWEGDHLAAEAAYGLSETGPDGNGFLRWRRPASPAPRGSTTPRRWWSRSSSRARPLPARRGPTPTYPTSWAPSPAWWPTSVVFTLPALARVGLDAARAAERELDFDGHHQATGDWFTSRRIGERHAAHKVLVEPGSGRILGAHLFGHGAEEVVNPFALAMRGGFGAAELKRTTWAYPTKGSDIPYML